MGKKKENDAWRGEGVCFIVETQTREITITGGGDEPPTNIAAATVMFSGFVVGFCSFQVSTII